MATTIITKNGSGAPLAGDLQVGELAIDLTNKKLYSKEGTTVFEVGATGGGAAGTFTDLTATNSFTSVGIDDNATSTAITIDSSQNVSFSGDLTVDTNTLYVDSTNNRVNVGNAGTVTPYSQGDNFVIDAGGTDDGMSIIASNSSNIFFGDAAENRAGRILYLHSDDSMRFYTNGNSNKMTILSSGNVGIGELTPSAKLSIAGGTANNYTDGITLQKSGGNVYGIYPSTNNLEFRSVTGGNHIATFDYSGRVGIGATSPKTQLQSSGGGTLNAPSLGSSSTNAPLYLTNNDTAYGLVVGNSSADGHVWLQAQRTDGTATAYNITLNEAGGNVGIAESDPSTALDVSGDATFKKAGGTVLILENSTSGGYAGDGTELQGAIYFKNNDSSGDGDHIGAKIESYVVDAIGRSNLEFYTGRSDTDLEKRMTIDQYGRVGIGTSSPDSRLTVEAPTGDYAVLLTPSGDTTGAVTTSYIGFDVRSSTANGPEPAAYIGVEEASTNSVQGALVFATRQTNNNTVAPTEAMRIDSSGNVGVGTNTIAAEARMIVDGGRFYINSDDQYGLLLQNAGTSGGFIGTTAANTLNFYNSSGTEHMRIDSSGNLLIGRTSTVNSATDYGTQLYSSGQIYLYSSSGGTADVIRGYDSTGTNTFAIDADGTYQDLSDEKYKENIAPSERGLPDIMALNVVSFDWNNKDKHETSGFIAQEIEQCIPELVAQNEDTGDLRIRTNKLIPMLTKALQEAVTRIETLEAEVAALKGA